MTLSASALVTGLVLMAVATSCIVFTEPAPVDILLIGSVAALLVLGQSAPGMVSRLALALWAIHVGCAVFAVMLSPNMASALTHSLITLYLAVAGCVLAGWIAGDPGRRFDLVMRAYVVAVLIAVVAGIVGYFGLLPGSYDLFTNYGRARGTFKDPNVFGAAITPALAYLAWKTLHAPPRQAALSLLLAMPIGFGVLLSFSRGAWFAAAVSLAWIGLFAIAGAWTAARQARLVIVAGGVLAGLAIVGGLALQSDKLADLMQQRASLTQSYDVGSQGRFGGQSKAFELIAENPLGIGTHTFRERHHHEEVHNVYLSLLLNGGWLGGAAYLLLVVLTLQAGIRQCLRPGPLQAAQIVATAAFLGLVLEGFVIDTDHWRHFFILQACVLGLSDSAARAAALAATAPRRATITAIQPQKKSAPAAAKPVRLPANPLAVPRPGRRAA